MDTMLRGDEVRHEMLRIAGKKVEVGYVSMNIVEITKGLSTGDLVVRDPQSETYRNNTTAGIAILVLLH